jgi:heme A synthase
VIFQQFLIALGLTVVALAVVVWTGLSRRKSAHYSSIVALLGLLAWAIREAELMGAGLIFEGASGVFRKVHFAAVALTLLAIPLLAVTGTRLAKKPTQAHRKTHRKLGFAFVAIVLVTSALGTAMTLLASPAPTNPSSAGEP